MCQGYTRRQVCLMNNLRLLWSQHVYWTRFFIISTAADLDDLESVTNRLLQNPKDFAQLFARFYGVETAEKFQKLFTEHLLIAADLVNAAKDGETAKVNEARRKWYGNADQIACFLSEINPNQSRKMWKEMMYSHLEMTEREATLRLQGNFAADIRTFGNIEIEAMKMADCMSMGIISRFSV